MRTVLVIVITEFNVSTPNKIIKDNIENSIIKIVKEVS